MGTIIFNIFMIALFAWAVIEAMSWRSEVALFPAVVACLGLVFAAAQLAIELWKRRRAVQAMGAGTAGGDNDAAVFRVGLRGTLWLFCGFACVVLLGVPVGLPLFVAVLIRYGFRDSWYLATGVAAAVVFLILMVFGGIFGATWADPLLLDILY